MNYEDILQNIKQDDNNELQTSIYRYNGILEAIRFFANRLTYEQITDTSFDFVNELLTADKSVMLLFREGRYKVHKTRGVNLIGYELAQTPELAGFALYVGNVIHGRSQLEAYFPKDLLDAVDANVMIPLTLEDKLNGFVLVSGRVSGKFNESDILVCETLMNLFNNALEGCMRLERLQVTNRELDEKIFNLFAINQSAKAMLTEHRLEELYSLAVDVFSELTQSAYTGFFLFDDPSEKYTLKAYRDVFHANTLNKLSFTLNEETPVNTLKQIADLSVDADIAYFESLYLEGIAPLEMVNARYVVFIYGKQGKVLGFVTLGETVSGALYKKSAFELVDSLASYTYIALSNAMLLKVVNDQKELLQLKLDRLMTLNTLMKNINSADSSSRMIALALETLTVSFGVESCLVTLYNDGKDTLDVHAASDPSLEGLSIPMNEIISPLREGKILFESRSENVSLYVGDEISNAIREKSGVLMIPMTLDRYELKLIGAIMIFRHKKSVLSNEEDVLTYETVANHMAPLIEGFSELERRMRLYKPDVLQLFLNEVEAQIRECIEYAFDLEIIQVVDRSASPFAESGAGMVLKELLQNVYRVSYDRTYLVVQSDFEYNYQFVCNSVSGTDVLIKRFRLFKDFNTFEEFLSLQSG